MSTIGSINLSALENAMEHELDPQNFQFWYNELIDLELEGNETPEVLETIFRGLKWILVYEHTNAEELKEIAEKEAVDMAEKEENWEQEKELLKEELSSLRERITSKAGMDDMNEAFRAEIDSLKAESNHLKQQLRERDRELADQRDKNEDLSAKYENAEKERTMLLTNQSQLEDTIREMNRRIITKTDVSKNDWEARKLKQRSEQAITLSNQLQNAINQNDHLQIEVDRLSKALEQATNLIKETTEKYASIQEELTNSEKTVEKLLEDNSTLKKQFLKKQTSFNEKEEIFQMNSKEFDDLIKQKDSQIEKYRENLQKLQMENENQRERLNLINDEEKEAELERLRKELIEATKLAKQLFGSMSGGGGSDEKMIGQNIDPTSELRLRILQLNKELEITEGKLAKLKEENDKLEKIAIEKDEINSKISGELNRLRKVIFGDADDEIKNLEQQIGFRDEQIKELTTKCSLLQIELERYVGVEVSSPRKTKNEEKHVSKVGKVDKTGKKDLDEKGRRKDVSKEEKPVIPPSKTMESEISSSSESFEEVPKSPVLPKKEMTEKYLNDVEASAMIISSLNYELMKVMKENEDKERLLKEMEKTVRDHSKDLQLSRAKISQLMKNYAELKTEKMISLDSGIIDQEEQAKLRKMEEMEIKIIELERLAETIKQTGPELHRRMEEATRKLIYVQIKNAEYERKAENSNRMKKSAIEMVEKMKEKLRTVLIGESRQIQELVRDYELNMIEIARLQNQLIHSVPINQYDKILKKYKMLAQKTGLNVDYDEKTDPAFLNQETPNISANFAISPEKSSMMIENLTLRVHQVDQLNQILENQNDYLKKEMKKQEIELDELHAFLDDIENQTEIKSLIVNIQKRFLQALHEQTDSTELQYFSDKELRNLQKKFSLRRKAWKDERQNLVGIIFGLQQTIQNLKAQTTSTIKIDHLIQFKDATDDLRIKEEELKEKEEKIQKELENVGVQKSLVEAQTGTIKELIDNGFDLQRIQKTIQGYQFNVLALSNELKNSKIEVEKLKNMIENQKIQIMELKRENENLLFSQMDIKKLSSWKNDSDADDEEGEEKIEKSKNDLETNDGIFKNAFENLDKIGNEEDESLSESTESSLSNENDDKNPRIRTVIYDNSSEYEKQLEKIKERTKICIESYKDQLKQKEDAIEQYKLLLLDLSQQLEENSKYSRKIQKGEDGEKIKTSSELLNDVKMEEKEREINFLKNEIKNLENINADLSEKLGKLIQNSKKNQKNVSKTKPVAVLKSNETKIEEKSKKEDGFEDDFETDSESEREDVKTPIQEDFERSNGVQNDKDDEVEDEDNDSVVAETSGESSDSNEGGTTDSGTVEDIDEKPRRKSSSTSSRASSNGEKKLKGKTPIPTPKEQPKGSTQPLVVAGDDREHVIYNQRNEIRKLRERISTFERKARQLEAERDAWKERNRFGGKKEYDPEAETSALKKENERLKRESKNLTRTLENQKKTIDDLEKALTKRMTSIQNKESLENWEEKKKREAGINALKKKLEECLARESELEEKLERRERHIEQIQNQQIVKSQDTEKLQQLMRLIRTEKDNFDKREIQMKQECELWQSKSKDLMTRLDLALKENKSLKNRLQSVQIRLEEVELQLTSHPHVPSPPIKISPPRKSDIQIQTTDRSSTRSTARFYPEKPSVSLEPIQEPQITIKEIPVIQYLPSNHIHEAEYRAEIQKLKKESRFLDLRKTELEEELERLKKSYHDLHESYTKLLKIEKDRPKESEKIAAIAVLRDKLMAKDKEIEIQRHKIDELERVLFNRQNRGFM